MPNSKLSQRYYLLQFRGFNVVNTQFIIKNNQVVNSKWRDVYFQHHELSTLANRVCRLFTSKLRCIVMK